MSSVSGFLYFVSPFSARPKGEAVRDASTTESPSALMMRIFCVVLLSVVTLPARGEHFAVTPAAETEPVPARGDAADDIAIWVHPTDPAASLVIGTNKQNSAGKGGLYVYDLAGKEVSSVTGSAMNNVDGRYGFTLAGKRVDIFAATNRSDDSLDLFVLDPKTRTLSSVGSIPLGKDSVFQPFIDPYGVTLYHDHQRGKFHAFVSDNTNNVIQFELVDVNGKITGKLVRRWKEAGIIEGMVADDRYGHIYIGAERGGIYRHQAVPDAANAGADAARIPGPPADRKVVDVVGRQGHLTADVEGLAIYETRDGGGYLLASSQGNNTYVIYDRKSLAYLATFEIQPNARRGIDGVNDTDGIDVISGRLNGDYTVGLFIVQDGANDNGQTQNFKYVSWADIVAGSKGVKLLTEDKFDPRSRN